MGFLWMGGRVGWLEGVWGGGGLVVGGEWGNLRRGRGGDGEGVGGGLGFGGSGFGGLRSRVVGGGKGGCYRLGREDMGRVGSARREGWWDWRGGSLMGIWE